MLLTHLLRHIDGKLLIIWDGASIRRGQAVTDFLAAGAAQRIDRERLPGDAPELNPDEGIWSCLEYRARAHVVCQGRRQLRYELRLVAVRLRHKLHVIWGCISQAGWSL
jgi:hypothetical protein